MSILSRPYFHDDAAAFAYLEAVMWPHGPECPHCGCVSNIKKIAPNTVKRVRLGLHRCGDCKKQFTVTVGTVFEASKVPLHKWMQAVFLMSSSKKGVSAHQLHRGLEVTYKTAWFMAHRIREAMREGALLPPFGQDGGVVEVDETFIGHDKTKKPKGMKKGRGYAHKHKVLALVDRNTGKARMMVVDDLNVSTLLPILRENMAKEAVLMTDEAQYYKPSLPTTSRCGHSMGEYVSRHDPLTHTNTIEGCFSVFKRGMKGVYQHCGKRHLHRYAAEFEFRYNNRSANGVEDVERTELTLRGGRGKRLTSQRPDSVLARA